jgi:hypothetical protein
VEMMGCAQIHPLMYFQLNNIAMFRGAYMIIKVEHNITPGNMATTFTGVRINKNKIPMVSAVFNVDEIINNITIGKGGTSNSSIISNNILYADLGGVDRFKDIPDITYTYDDIMDLNDGNKKYISFANIISNNNGKRGAYNESNPDLRKLVYGLTKRASETIGGLQITSMARNTTSTTQSDHAIGPNITSNERRKKLSGLNYMGINQTYDKMGCAVDLLGTDKNGLVDRNEKSIALFDIIALEYTNNIRQLIWEVKEGACLSNNSISNCIHLASYGHGNKNDKCQIFVGAGPGCGAIIADNGNDTSKAPRNIPPMFIKTLYRMALAGKDLNKIMFSNFKVKLTKEILAKWCKELGV